MAAASYFDQPPLQQQLAGFLLLTRSAHRHLTLQWASHQLPAGLLPALTCRARFNEPYFGRHGGLWHYCFPRRAAAPSAEGTLAIVLSPAFSPEMLLTLAKVLSDAAAGGGGGAGGASGGTLAAQAAWLSAYTQGAIGEAWVAARFDAGKNFRATGAKALLSALGVEAILVWAALMLRKRVAVLGGSASEVIRAVRLLPLLVAHRYDAAATAAGGAATLASPAGLMHPYVALGDAALLGSAGGGEAENEVDLGGPLGAATRAALEEGTAAQLADLSEGGSWVAGFTDASVASRGGELWDVAVDLRARTVVVADAAKGACGAGVLPLAAHWCPHGSFSHGTPPPLTPPPTTHSAHCPPPHSPAGELALGSVHKEVAKALVEALESSETSDGAVLAAVASKTDALVSRLCAIFTDGLPVGIPAGALPVAFTGALPMEGIVGDSASAALRAGFRDALARAGMGAAVGSAAGEGFLWGVCGAEPRVQLLASQAVERARVAVAAAAAAAAGAGAGAPT
jgi:hypothetical protein